MRVLRSTRVGESVFNVCDCVFSEPTKLRQQWWRSPLQPWTNPSSAWIYCSKPCRWSKLFPRSRSRVGSCGTHATCSSGNSSSMLATKHERRRATLPSWRAREFHVQAVPSRRCSNVRRKLLSYSRRPGCSLSVRFQIVPFTTQTPPLTLSAPETTSSRRIKSISGCVGVSCPGRDARSSESTPAAQRNLYAIVASRARLQDWKGVYDMVQPKVRRRFVRVASRG